MLALCLYERLGIFSHSYNFHHNQVDLIDRTSPKDFKYVDNADVTERGIEKLLNRVEMDATKFFHQISTVGSGNHFVEIGVTPAGNYSITVHSGSRNLGQKVWKYWHMIAHDPNFNHPSIGYLAGEAYCATPQKFSVSDFWGATQSETPLFFAAFRSN